MAAITCPEVFTDTGAGDAVNAQRLNNALNALEIQPEAISALASATPASTDLLSFNDVSAGVLAKGTMAAVVGAVYPADPAAGTAGARTLGTAGTQAAPGNDSRFPATVTGLRKGAGVGSTDTAADGADLAFTPTASGNSGTAITLSCADSLCFALTMTGNCTITLTNLPDGAVVRVKTVQDGTGNRTVTFASSGLTVTKEGGAAAASTAAAAIDLWTVEKWGTALHVSVRKAYA